MTMLEAGLPHTGRWLAELGAETATCSGAVLDVGVMRAKAVARAQQEIEAERTKSWDQWHSYGRILRRVGAEEEAIAALGEAVRMEPLDWTAWMEMLALCATREDLAAVTLPKHWARSFFDVEADLKFQDAESALEKLEALEDTWGHTLYMQCLVARAYYVQGDYEEAMALFQRIRQQDPYLLDYMDDYSNILYVNQEQEALAKLAADAAEIDACRPETYCIIGNYYSMKGNRAKSTLYFEKAVQIKPDYVSAWTLLGHEYLDARRLEDAAKAYRSVVDLRGNDYRAWFGLGQLYEMKGNLSYSCYYYHQAARIRPHDIRMWCALGDAREASGANAIPVYKTAIEHCPDDTFLLKKLATLLIHAHQLEDAEQVLDQLVPLDLEQASESILHLIEAYKLQRNSTAVRRCCHAVLSFTTDALMEKRIAEMLEEEE